MLYNLGYVTVQPSFTNQKPISHLLFMLLGYILVLLGVLENGQFFENPYLYNPRFMEIQDLDPFFRLFWERNVIGIIVLSIAAFSLFGIYIQSHILNQKIIKRTDQILHISILMLIGIGIASFTVFYDLNINGYTLLFMGNTSLTGVGMFFLGFVGIFNIYQSL